MSMCLFAVVLSNATKVGLGRVVRTVKSGRKLVPCLPGV